MVAAFSVTVALPETAMEVGLKLAVTPAGRPAIDRSTVPAKPASGLTATEAVAALPGRIVIEPGVVETMKSRWATTGKTDGADT